MDDDDSREMWFLKYRIARLRSTLNLVGVFLAHRELPQADDEALQQRIALALELDQSDADPGSTT